MKYEIVGASAKTAADIRLHVEADSEMDAIRIANEHGVFPDKITRVVEPPPATPLLTSPAAEQVEGEQKRNDQAGMRVLGGGIFLVLLLIWSGAFSSNSDPSLPSPLHYSPSYQYESAADRELKDLPSLRGFSESEKEQIISAAKDLDRAVKVLERKRGY